MFAVDTGRKSAATALIGCTKPEIQNMEIQETHAGSSGI